MRTTGIRARALPVATFIALCAGCGGGASSSTTPVVVENIPANADGPRGIEGKYLLYGESAGDAGAQPFVALKSAGKADFGGVGQVLSGDYQVKGVVVTLTLPGEKHEFVNNGKGCLLGGMIGSYCKGGAKPAASAQKQGDLSSGSVTMGAPTPAVVNTISGSFYTKDGDTQLTFSADGRISIIRWKDNQMATELGLYEVEGTKITITTDGGPLVLERKDNTFEQTAEGAVTVYQAG